jgi:hypothetical protein
MNLTKNLSFPKNYHIKERKVNSISVFADKSVTATEKQNKLL